MEEHCVALYSINDHKVDENEKTCLLWLAGCLFPLMFSMYFPLT